MRDDEHEEPYEGRLSRTDPWEHRGEIPLRDPIICKRRTVWFDTETRKRKCKKKSLTLQNDNKINRLEYESCLSF